MSAAVVEAPSEGTGAAPKVILNHRWWEEVNTYGRARAERAGLTEADVVPAVKQVRKERHARRRTRPPAR